MSKFELDINLRQFNLMCLVLSIQNSVILASMFLSVSMCSTLFKLIIRKRCVNTFFYGKLSLGNPATASRKNYG